MAWTLRQGRSIRRTRPRRKRGRPLLRRKTGPIRQSTENRPRTYRRISFGRVPYATDDLAHKTTRTKAALREAEEDRTSTLKDTQAREDRIKHRERRLPLFGLGAVFLVLAMTALPPRLMVINPTASAVFGGSWTTTTTSTRACVFYRQSWSDFAGLKTCPQARAGKLCVKYVLDSVLHRKSRPQPSENIHVLQCPRV